MLQSPLSFGDCLVFELPTSDTTSDCPFSEDPFPIRVYSPQQWDTAQAPPPPLLAPLYGHFRTSEPQQEILMIGISRSSWNICNEGCSSSTAIGPFNDCKWVFNEVSLTLWCHAVVHLEVTMGRFTTCFIGYLSKNSRRSPVCQAMRAVLLPH